MRRRTEMVFIGLAVTACITLIVAAAYSLSQRETYLSEDPLYGSFRINPIRAGTVYPADFLISVDVKTDDRILLQCAEESGVDISSGCWVYCFAENKVFRGEKRRDMLLAYEGNRVIGKFEYTASDFLGFSYDAQYKARWRGTELALNKTRQGLVFP